MTREGPAPMSGYPTLRSSRSQLSTSARSQSADGIGAQLRTKHQCDQLPDFTPDRGRLLALGDGLGRPAAVLPVGSPASLQALGRAWPGTRAAVHPAAAIRHRGRPARRPARPRSSVSSSLVRDRAADQGRADRESQSTRRRPKGASLCMTSGALSSLALRFRSPIFYETDQAGASGVMVRLRS